MADITRENATEIIFPAGKKLDNCVKILLEAKERGESVFGEFNGHKLYSCDVTMDGAYMEVFGMTKAEFDEEDRKLREEYKEREKREKEEAETKIPEWIEKGKAFIYPQRLQEWEECVKARAEDLYHGIDLNYALEIMEKLESGATIEETIETFENQGNSGASAGMIRKIVFYFSRRGPEFFEKTTDRELSEEEIQFIEEKKKENEELETIHGNKKEETEKPPVGSTRAKEEEEIVSLATRRAQLIIEISDIGMQLAKLKKQEEELMKQFRTKQDELNKLFE